MTYFRHAASTWLPSGPPRLSPSKVFKGIRHQPAEHVVPERRKHRALAEVEIP